MTNAESPGPGAFRRAATSRHTEPGTRRITVEWDDLAEIAHRAPRISGVELLRAVSAGELPAPPIHHLLGIVEAEVEEGHVTFTLAPHESHENPMGVVHGGVLATVLDSAMGCAVHSTLAAGTGYTTLNLQVTYVRPATAASRSLRAEGRAVHTGRRMASAEGRIMDAGGQLVAHGTETCLIFPAGHEQRAAERAP